jgi:hypothetical protein
VNNVQFLIQVCKGLIRHQHARRTLMFYVVFVALVLVFAGSTLFWSWLRDHPLFFLGYFGLCAWLTVLAVLLAVYDMVKVRIEGRRARQQLAEKILHRNEPDSAHDSHST